MGVEVNLQSAHIPDHCRGDPRWSPFTGHPQSGGNHIGLLGKIITLNEQDRCWMERAILLARCAAAAGEVPVGAVLVRNGELIGEGYNRPIGACDPTAHAEILALRQAATHLGNYRLPDSVLYVTLEPCPMCAGAIVHARIKRVVFGASDPRSGAAGTVFNLLQAEPLNHRVEVEGGVLGGFCSELLREFFRLRRASDGVPNSPAG